MERSASVIVCSNHSRRYHEEMDAGIYLQEIAEQFAKLGFEAILIGNAAAAIQGAPVTTIDIDFLFRETPSNVAKLKTLAKAMDLVIFIPRFPASPLTALRACLSALASQTYAAL